MHSPDGRGDPEIRVQNLFKAENPFGPGFILLI